MAKTTKKETVQISALAEINTSDIVELKGWEKKQLDLVKANPFIEVTNHETYTAAKKNRTNLRSGRTELQNQDKALAKHLTAFRKMLGSAADKLIAITKEAEDTQQTEISKYELKKADEKAEKERLRLAKLKELTDVLNATLEECTNMTAAITYENKDESKKSIQSKIQSLDAEIFESPGLFADEKINNVMSLVTRKIAEVDEEYVMKVRRAKLEAEEKEMAEKKAKAKKEEEERLRREEADRLAKHEERLMEIISIQREYLEMKGYKETEPQLWVKGTHHVSTNINVWENGEMSINFLTVADLRKSIELEELAIKQRLENEQRAKEVEAEKKAKAKKKVDDLVSEVKMNELKDIEVEAETVWTPIQIEADCHNINAKIEVMLGILAQFPTLNTPELKTIWSNTATDIQNYLMDVQSEVDKIKLNLKEKV